MARNAATMRAKESAPSHDLPLQEVRILLKSDRKRVANALNMVLSGMVAMVQED
jgi:hypothetical protein